MAIKHTATFMHHRVLVRLKDGTRILDRFVTRGSGWIELRAYGKIRLEKLESFAPYRAGAAVERSKKDA